MCTTNEIDPIQLECIYIYTQKDNEILPIDNNIYLVKTKKNLWWIDSKKIFFVILWLQKDDDQSTIANN